MLISTIYWNGMRDAAKARCGPV